MKISSMLYVEIDGLPPTVNQMYRSGRNGTRYKRPEVSDWQEETAAKMREAWNDEAYSGNVEVHILFTVKKNRRWDIDNRLKALLDCLELGGVIRNDAQIWRIDARKEQGETDKVLLCMKEYAIVD